MQTYTHNTGAFIGKEGYEIFFQSWSVPSPKAIVVIAHGVGEHSARYQSLAADLTAKNTSVYALDHRGHGKSGGKRGHVNSFNDYIYDLKHFIEYVSEEGKNTPIILLGHSMGGVIALKYGLTYPEDLTSMIISAAGLIPAFEVPKIKISMANFFSKHIPSLSMSSGLKAGELSRDYSVVDDYENDPLVHDRVTPRWYTEFTATAEECLNRASEIQMPVLFFHGSGDKICDYRGTIQAYENASSKVKELEIFEGFYHEAHNEIPEDRKKVIDVILKWLDKVSGKKKTSAKKKAAPAAKKTASQKKKTAAKPKKNAGSKKTTTKPKPKKTAPKKKK